MSIINNTQKIIILIFCLSFLTIPVLGNINLTFQSDNEKIINIINLDDNYAQISSNTTNQSINLSYNNYIIKLYSSNTKITNNNGSFIINNLSDFNYDWQIIFWIALIIILIIVFFQIVGKQL